MATTYLTRTPSGSGSQRKFTFSFWVKRSGLSSQQHIFTQYSANSGDRQFRIEFQANDTMRIYNTDGAADWIFFATNRVFRDPSAWMQIVVAIDTTQSTESNRVKIYINGSQETSFSSSTYPSLNRDFDINTTAAQVIGALSSGSVSSYFDGSLTHFHFIDGTAYSASDFGETDSTSGIWKPKTAPSVTYGTNGYFLKFENSGAMGTDSSGQSNTFTVNGTLTQNVDTPSNNFATFNALNNNSTLTNGNLTATTDSAQKFGSSSTLGVSSGKFYWEMKVNATYLYTGVDYNPAEALRNNDPIRSHGWCYNADGLVYNNGSGSSFGNTFTTNDIIGVALDATNSKLYFSKNGTWQNSGNPESGATGTGAVSITANETYFAVMGDGGSSVSSGASANFGQGYFGTTVVASAGTAPSEGGIFEYDCPSGYQALCTKGINSF